MLSDLRAAFSSAVTPTDNDGVNQLLSMDDSAVRVKVGGAFVAQMQNAGRVRGFFGLSAQPVPMPAAQEDWIGQVASALIALSLGHTSGHGFSACVNMNAATNFLNSNLTYTNTAFFAVAMNNYAALFAANCATSGPSPVTFGNYSGGAYGSTTHWGTALASAMKSPAYINVEMAKLNPAVDPGGWYSRFYANLFKVTVLNNAEVAGGQSAWNPYLKGREKPDAASWPIYDHMVAGSFSYSTFFNQMLNAVNASHSSTRTLGCHGGPAASCTTETTTTYGAALNDWLNGNRGLGGFINGPSSSNEESHANSGGKCFVPGTPILLADGSSRAIEDVAPGMAVVSRDGVVLARSRQDIHWPIAEHGVLFGFNDYAPFFDASHPLMTTQGWKSMSPAASL